MKKIKSLLAVIAGVVAFSSCVMTMPVTATSNPVGSKVGSSKAQVFLGVYYQDADFSIRTAAKNGGIKKISTVDLKRTDYLGFMTIYETIVTGE